jgi:hypothetical protein
MIDTNSAAAPGQPSATASSGQKNLNSYLPPSSVTTNSAQVRPKQNSYVHLSSSIKISI